jgi:hypothetical protein
MRSRLALLVIAVLLGGVTLAVLVRAVRMPNPRPPSSITPTSTSSEPLMGGTLTFRSNDGVTSVTFDAPTLTNGLVTMENPTMVHGTTTAFENTFQWRLADETGADISRGVAMTQSPDAGIPGPFFLTVFYDRMPASSRGTFTVYESSARDGEPIHVVNIPIVFAFTRDRGCSSSVMIAMRDATRDPGVLDCGATTRVARTVCGTPSLPLAIHELLQGPTEEESKNGYETNLAQGTRDPQITVDASGYRLDFDQSIQNGVAGSCRVGAIRAQIEDTVLAFDASATRAMVHILMNGNADEVLQP